MSTAVQIRKGTTAEHATFTGALAEITVDTDKDVVVVHDGTTAGGFPLAKETTVGMRKPASVGGTVDAITATFSPAFTSLAACAGYVLALPLTGANTTTPTLNIDGLGAKTIVKGSNEALAVANIPGADFVGLFVYDASLDKFQMVNPYAAPASQLSVLGFKNKIINGKMEIAQRGTSFAAIASGAYHLDRWRFANSSSAVVTISQQTDVPSNNEFYNSMRTAVTTADTSIAAGDFAGNIQSIEGSNVRNLIGNTFTISFWVRSAKTGIHCIALRNAATEDRAFISEYTVNVANTWEKKTILVSGGLITAGNWNWTNGTGLQIVFVLACGSTFQTTAGAWQTGNFLATANQVNVLDTVGNIFAITGVQLEIGAEATIFDHRSVGQELELCERYCEKSYDYSVSPGSPSNNGVVVTRSVSNDGFLQIRYRTKKRAVPTVIVYSPATGSSGVFRNIDTNTDVSASSAYPGESSILIIGTVGTGAHVQCHYLSTAEL